MDFVNETKVEAGWTLGFQPDGRELLVVVVKATLDIPAEGEEPSLTEEQVPLTEADEFTGEPGFSATLYESDYAHHKPLCDVLLNGNAYAPGGKPAKKVTVGLQIGPITKRFEVTGDRIWEKVPLSVMPTPPEPFTKLPISYDRAYGGTDTCDKKPDEIKTYLENPIGIGYYPLTEREALIGKPLPNTHEISNPVETTSGRFRPMSFGPIGRNVKCRYPLAGTYDDDWLNTRAPFFPDDFDYRYFQAAPSEQQMPYPAGAEAVILENLTPDGFKRFRLPTMPMPVLFVPYSGDPKQQDGAIDTIVIEADQQRFMLTWRTSFPLRRNCFELEQVVVGKTLEDFQRDAMTRNKTRYAGLGELIRAKGRGEF